MISGLLRSETETDGMPGTSFDAVAAFDDHGSALLGYAINALRDRALAEDCVQEAFLKAWRSRASFDPGRGSERAWLFTILRSVLVDTLRAQSRVAPLDDGDGARAAPTSDDATHPLDRLQLQEALAALSDEHRAVVVGVHLEGLSYQELSARTSVPVATLRTRAFYALRAMRAHFISEGES